MFISKYIIVSASILPIAESSKRSTRDLILGLSFIEKKVTFILTPQLTWEAQGGKMMTKFIGLKSVFLTLVLAICISIITSTNLFAATLTKTYTVKSGDCLSVIAQNHGESLNNLRKANKKWNDLIFPGQFLDVSVVITSTVKQPRHSVATTSTVNKLAPRSTNYTSSDVNLLARLITAEAGGTSYNDQVSVGAVVLNRVKSNLFPNSIHAVIYQNSQFTPITNGSINKTAQTSAIKAAHAALSGNDPTNKALYFHNDNDLIFQY